MKDYTTAELLDNTAKESEVLNGYYYLFDCMNEIADRLLYASWFKDDREAKQLASNIEATLFKYEYRNGERVSSETLYDPYDCFN